MGAKFARRFLDNQKSHKDDEPGTKEMRMENGECTDSDIQSQEKKSGIIIRGYLEKKKETVEEYRTILGSRMEYDREKFNKFELLLSLRLSEDTIVDDQDLLLAPFCPSEKAFLETIKDGWIK